MPILSNIGRKNPGVRLLLAGMYLILFLGGVAMVYPFLLIAGGSASSSVDVKDKRLVPAFLRDDEALYRKHVEGLFNESVEAMNTAYDLDVRSFEELRFPSMIMEAEVAAWNEFLSENRLPVHAWTIGYSVAEFSRTVPHHLRAWRQSVQKEYAGDLPAANRALGTDFPGWNDFLLMPENYITRTTMPARDAFRSSFAGYRQKVPAGERIVFSLDGYFRRVYLASQYGRDVEAYNAAQGTAFQAWPEVLFPRVSPKDSGRKDWEIFVRELLSPVWVRVDPDQAPAWSAYLAARYGSIEILNRNWDSSFPAFEQVPLPERAPEVGMMLADWISLLQGWPDPETGIRHEFSAAALKVEGPDVLWRQHLAQKFSSVDELNAAFGTGYASFDTVPMPQQAAHVTSFLEHRGDIKWEFLTRNYRAVFDYLVFHGRGLVNTVIYCGLAVIFALIVNPLAAYALSRYRMRSAYKVLLFLLLTMAFPPMVTQIPSFLMLREFNMLNTFAALVLPGLANGYSIFLLKGFFDSQPRDLYESAQIDGASEWTMFWQITMSLSKPILAVIALQAFTHAYSNFMFALLICQDESMWTLMVWLYELQQKSGQGVLYASLVVAAIPTFVIFSICQNVILRGIVVPVEK